MSKNVKLVLATALVVICCTAIFMFFYGKSYETEIHKRYVDSLNTNTEMLQRKIKVSDTAYAVLNSKYLQAIKLLENKKVEYVEINKKYDDIADVVNIMPIDDQVRFLSEWLSQSDPVQR